MGPRIVLEIVARKTINPSDVQQSARPDASGDLGPGGISSPFQFFAEVHASSKLAVILVLPAKPSLGFANTAVTSRNKPSPEIFTSAPFAEVDQVFLRICGALNILHLTI